MSEQWLLFIVACVVYFVGSYIGVRVLEKLAKAKRKP